MEINTYDWIMSDGYWIMPNKVLFDKNLSDKQKLLYCLISSLCAEKGYCWASNNYLAEKIWYNKNNMYRLLNWLISEWYISTVDNKEIWNQRRIYINSIHEKVDPIHKNVDSPIHKNVEHNNIIYNNTIIPDSNSLNSNTEQGKTIIPQLDIIKNSDDVRELFTEDEISQKNIQLKILLKMIDLWYKVKKSKAEVIKQFDWLKAKANLYNIKQADGNIAWMTFYQKIDKRYDWHTEKNKPVKNFKTSIVPFLSK